VELKTQVRERLIGERMIAWLAGTFGILAVAWRAARIRLDEALRCEQRQRFSLEIDPGRSRY
jgi:hypothetical protein